MFQSTAVTKEHIIATHNLKLEIENECISNDLGNTIF